MRRLAAVLILATALAGCSDHQKKDDQPAPQPSVSSVAVTEQPKPSQPTAPMTDGSGPAEIRSLLPSE